MKIGKPWKGFGGNTGFILVGEGWGAGNNSGGGYWLFVGFL